MGEFSPGQWRSADCFGFTRHTTETERENGLPALGESCSPGPWAPGELTTSCKTGLLSRNANLQPYTGHLLHGCIRILASSPLRL